jgi:hypothetical protein
MKHTSNAMLLLIGLSLAACGDHLGEYKVEEVRLVQQIPRDAVDGRRAPYRDYLRIELSSEANLNAAKTGPGLYTDADFCPLRNPDRMIAFGPVGTDGKAVESWQRDRFKPDVGDGRYHYAVFVVPSSPPRKLFTDSTGDIPAYDLRRDARDLCVRFFVPGYNIIPSRSDTVRVAHGLIAGALRPKATTP